MGQTENPPSYLKQPKQYIGGIHSVTAVRCMQMHWIYSAEQQCHANILSSVPQDVTVNGLVVVTLACPLTWEEDVLPSSREH